MKKCNIVFNILTVIAYFYGIVLCATLVLIPLGVYAVISAHRYSDFAGYSQFQLSQNKQNIKKWIAFGCVLYFPFGLLGLLCLSEINNNIVVEDSAQTQEQSSSQDGQSAVEAQEQTVEVEIHNPQTQAEKAEKLEKLERFRQNGLITNEEFEQAKSQLYDTDK